MEMFKLDGMRNNNDELFELWTKELEKELPAFWNEFLSKENRDEGTDSDSYSKSFSKLDLRNSGSG